MATEFGKQLKDARNFAKMTQKDAEKETGIPQSTISTAEREGESSTETVTYARAYKVDAHWLATGEGQMEVATTSIQSSQVQSVRMAATTGPFDGAFLRLGVCDRGNISYR